MDIVKKLREEINEQLSKVTKENCPKIYEKIKTQEGYLIIEEKIINMICNEGLSASACIPQIEIEL